MLLLYCTTGLLKRFTSAVLLVLSKISFIAFNIYSVNSLAFISKLTNTVGFILFTVIPNRCLNSTCSHICLPSPSKLTDYICACPQGSLLDWTKRTCLCENGGRLLEDGVSCEVMKDFIAKDLLVLHLSNF